jgi:hypothetical protein
MSTPDDWPVISWTPDMLKRFKKKYEAERAAGHDQFNFDGHDFVCGLRQVSDRISGKPVQVGRADDHHLRGCEALPKVVPHLRLPAQ